MKYKLMHPKAPSWCNITHHAVEQFIARWAMNKNQEEASIELLCLLNSSAPKGKTPHGDQIYVSGHAPDIRMVIKDRNVCVTVLPPGNLDDATLLYEEELQVRKEAYEEIKLQFEAEIADLEGEVSKVNEKRKALDDQKKILSDEKHKLHNKIDKLRIQLKSYGV